MHSAAGARTECKQQWRFALAKGFLTKTGAPAPAAHAAAPAPVTAPAPVVPPVVNWLQQGWKYNTDNDLCVVGFYESVPTGKKVVLIYHQIKRVYTGLGEPGHPYISWLGLTPISKIAIHDPVYCLHRKDLQYLYTLLMAGLIENEFSYKAEMTPHHRFKIKTLPAAHMKNLRRIWTRSLALAATLRNLVGLGWYLSECMINQLTTDGSRYQSDRQRESAARFWHLRIRSTLPDP